MPEISEVTASGENDIYSSSGFLPWLEAHDCSIVYTTYQAGKLSFLGTRDNRLWLHERAIEHCQGLWTNGNKIWVSSLYQLHMLQNALPKGERMTNGCDANFVPRITRTTGQLDTHDIIITDAGQLLFANTRYNCIATPSDTASFECVWKPPFISKLVPEDRCHINGLTLKDGKPGFATCLARSDVLDGWRDKRRDGGIVIDLQSNEIVTTGLSMPHSPRYRDKKLWVLNSGQGEFGYIDLKTGKFEAVCFCPGYARGLALIGDYAVIGLSLPRVRHTFDGLALDDLLKEKDTEARCGLIIVDIKKGIVMEWLRIKSKVTELYDVSILPGIRQPRAVGFMKKEELCSEISLEVGKGFAA